MTSALYPAHLLNTRKPPRRMPTTGSRSYSTLQIQKGRLASTHAHNSPLLILYGTYRLLIEETKNTSHGTALNITNHPIHQPYKM